MENAAAFLCRKSVLSYGQYYLIKFQGFPPKVRSRTNKGKNEWISRAETGHRAILPYCRDSREIGNSFRPKSWEGAGSISRAEVVPFREYSGAPGGPSVGSFEFKQRAEAWRWKRGFQMLVWSSEGEDVWRRVRVLSFWWGTIKCSSEHEQLIQACNWRLTKGYNHCPVVTGSNFVTCLHSFYIALWQLQLKCKVYSIKATLSKVEQPID